MLDVLSSILAEDNIKIDEPMKKHTSFKIGGRADFMALPQSIEEFTALISALKQNGVEFFVMGRGSNLLVADEGIRGVVIKTTELNNCSVSGAGREIISAEAGAALGAISKLALQESLSGFEFAGGIPGSLGGAIVMNAGAYGREMSDVVVSVDYVDDAGNLHTTQECEFGYRTSVFLKCGYVVLKSELKLERGESAEIEQNLRELARRRAEKQPLDMPSAGSVFKRPEGYFAGKLIEDCGLKGFRVGDAQVSEKHAGFIVNLGGATASDVRRLIEYIQERVLREFGVELETEVKCVGGE